ncbi:MAG TPA: hypothetical protein VF692_08355 [Pyrinomonadaceae bacterium]|jgi:hypothetical protein
MKVKKHNLLLFCLLAFSFFASGVSVFAQEETMTNEEVISLAKAGLNESIIINKIKTSKSNFVLSTDNLIKLKQAGISDEIVAAMLEAKSGKTVQTVSTAAAQPNARGTGDPNDPTALHNYGVYLYEEKDGNRKMTQMNAAVSAQNRTGGGFTAAVTPFGLGKVKTKANLPGTTAAMQIKETRPTFYFYLDATSGGLNTSSGVPSTPNEFALVRFNVRSDNREITIAKSNQWGSKGGLSDEYVVPFSAEHLGNGIYKVTPNVDLKKGEYAFYLVNSGNSNASAAVGAKFFDFGVMMTP